MAGWNGFTDQELSKLQSKGNEMKDAVHPKPSRIDKTSNGSTANKDKSFLANKSKGKGTETKKHISPNQLEATEKNVEKGIIQDKESDDKSCKEKENLGIQVSDDNSEVIETAVTMIKKSDSDIKENNNIDNKNIVNVDTEKEIRVLTDSEVAEAQISSLAKLQLQQKEIEEENKKKQSMIKQTLAERMKQTQTESNKLKNLTKELSKLDHLLQVDVKILRDKIDDACAEFHHAQCRFVDAEKEYVSAKLDFHKKKDLKDELQEHLLTIIQENEKRKAEKLEQLLQKLNSSDAL